MKGILTQNGVAAVATQQGIEQAAAGGALFWLDLDVQDPGPGDELTELLCDTFHFSPSGGGGSGDLVSAPASGPTA